MTRAARALHLLLFVAAAPAWDAAPASAGARPVIARARTQRLVDVRRRMPSMMLSHIVVLIQENRSTDNLFNGFCVNGGSVCANTVAVDPVSGTPLAPYSLAAPFGLSHAHSAFVTEYDYGKMDGFAKQKAVCHGGGHGCNGTPFAYVPPSETGIYRQLATVDGVLSDETFQTMQGPSVPAHFYAIAGQSGGYDSDHWAIEGGNPGSCATTQPVSLQILMTTPFPGQTGNKVPPCKDFTTIFDLVANAGHSWRFYSTGSGFWSPTQNIQHLYGSPNFIEPPNQFLVDVANASLADVTFITPPGGASDHPNLVKDASAGPAWVASVVNAIGETPYWNNTAVVIWWDDWGGFFDHVAPPVSPVNPDPFEYGFRVPLIVASAYANVGTVDHTTRTFVSALRLIEETFNLPSLGTTDQYEPDGLDSMFNFNQPPIAYTPLGGSSARPFKGRRKIHPR